jgi:hypothetical protein
MNANETYIQQDEVISGEGKKKKKKITYKNQKRKTKNGKLTRPVP